VTAERAPEQPGNPRQVIDTTKAHPARIYDFLLGGKDHFSSDRQAAEQVLQSWPTVRAAVRENRAFLGRVVRFLVAEAGIRQFLDIGAGLPSANNVHEVAQAIVPECRVVYVDNDPIVAAHGRALLGGSAQGRTAFVQADLRDPKQILDDQATKDTLDFTRPIALMLVALLHFVPDRDNPAGIIRTLIDALPSGSYVAATHAISDHDPGALIGAGRPYSAVGIHGELRTSDDFADLAFSGLELVDPGVVLVSEWRPTGTGPRPLPSEINIYAGVARKR
jgi:S-adenosyl methyltransferase